MFSETASIPALISDEAIVREVYCRQKPLKSGRGQCLAQGIRVQTKRDMSSKKHGSHIPNDDDFYRKKQNSAFGFRLLPR